MRFILCEILWCIKTWNRNFDNVSLIRYGLEYGDKIRNPGIRQITKEDTTAFVNPEENWAVVSTGSLESSFKIKLINLTNSDSYPEYTIFELRKILDNSVMHVIYFWRWPIFRFIWRTDRCETSKIAEIYYAGRFRFCSYALWFIVRTRLRQSETMADTTLCVWWPKCSIGGEHVQ